ncbi:glycosyltransferase [Roseovarius nanhaiticus]|uniref:Putative rhamnosyl transferase n=1 Tax=Roseovarius nanhaiticus TaxID=573024 RepID=A0A1N7FXN2_9RHOB|nr:glycosyltransferase [Roseovarius nanhaiticus]SEK42687.1 Putative rhamnosyl transferase [Roseovarius nanhaiticus]SIS05054.1 Putative rhamnosyl transferase [Roseovarius nanhaiticus]
MRIIGVCRFSYPALGGFKRMHDSVAEREAYLYAPARMALRFAHFETLTLPSVAAQTDPDFTFLIVIGQNMPQPWLGRLHALCAPVPQIKIVPCAPLKHRLALQLAIQDELGEERPESIQFRLDDDDAMGVDFVELARSVARRTGRLRRRERRTAIEFNTGYSATLSKDGIIAEDVISSFWACGLGVHFAEGDDKTIMNFGHHKLHHLMPSIIHPHPPMYIRAKHTDNDSEAKFRPRRLKPLSDAQRQIFQTRFNVDEERVQDAFAALDAPPGKG